MVERDAIYRNERYEFDLRNTYVTQRRMLRANYNFVLVDNLQGRSAISERQLMTSVNRFANKHGSQNQKQDY